MSKEIETYNQAEESIVVYRSADNAVQLDVQLSEETVWLTASQMAMLFDKEDSNIRRHIINIFNEVELLRENNVRFLHVNGVKKPVPFYSLDVIISVGYRVKSQRGVQFRRWANRILKEYILRGYAINQQLLAMQRQLDSRFEQQDSRMMAIESELHEHQEKIDFFVRTNMPPIEQVFFGGEFFEARLLLENLIKTAQKRVIVIDEYIDAATFEILDVRANGVTADIYSNSLHTTLRDAHNAATGVMPVQTHKWTNPSHDRWLIIDDCLYHCGHSLKDLGRKMSAITKMGISPDVILNYVN